MVWSKGLDGFSSPPMGLTRIRPAIGQNSTVVFFGVRPDNQHSTSIRLVELATGDCARQGAGRGRHLARAGAV